MSSPERRSNCSSLPACRTKRKANDWWCCTNWPKRNGRRSPRNYRNSICRISGSRAPTSSITWRRCRCSAQVNWTCGRFANWPCSFRKEQPAHELPLDRFVAMQNIVIAKTYRFVPPRFSPVWARIIQWCLPTYLRKSFGITSWECVGAERLRASLQAGSGVLVASNHCRPCDPMVLGLLSREVARPFHVMASWHLFMQSRLQSFLLPRIGGFSIYREGLDRESLKCAIRILAEARFPLTIFPEGFVTRNNDRLLNLMDGVAFLARSAAKQRAASPVPGKVVVHPIFIRYFFEGDITSTLAPVLHEIESRLSWQPQSHLPLRDRIVKAGHALLALKEIEYLGATQSGGARERLLHLLDHLLGPLEQEWTGGRCE